MLVRLHTRLNMLDAKDSKPVASGEWETTTTEREKSSTTSTPQPSGLGELAAYASRIMNDTEQRYHSNKQEFLALKWAVTDQFHEYLSPYGKNRNEFVVRTDNNPLTYIFSSTNLDAAGQRWVAQLASYNFSLEYQKGKDNTVADFLSRLDEPLPKREVQDYLDKIPYPGVKAVLDNAITPLEERAELGVRPKSRRCECRSRGGGCRQSSETGLH